MTAASASMGPATCVGDGLSVGFFMTRRRRPMWLCGVLGGEARVAMIQGEQAEDGHASSDGISAGILLAGSPPRGCAHA